MHMLLPGAFIEYFAFCFSWDATPYLKKGSSIVLISSIAGYQPPASMVMYGVTKTAILGLTKVLMFKLPSPACILLAFFLLSCLEYQPLASEMNPDSRVNCVALGFVPTHFTDYITKNEHVRKEIEGRTLRIRLGTTQDMAAAVAYLASDDAAYVTG